MTRVLGCGCLGLIGGGVLLLFAFSQSEMGQWAMGLLFVYGGAIFAGVLAYSTHDGVIANIEPTDSDFINGAVVVEFVDDSGTQRSERRQVVASPSTFSELQIGDDVTVLVCRTDPEVIKISGLNIFNKGECKLPDKEEAGNTN